MTRPDRIGMKTVSVTVTREKWKKLRHVVTETERTAGDLISEAIDDLAVKYPTTSTPDAKPALRRTAPECQHPPIDGAARYFIEGARLDPWLAIDRPLPDGLDLVGTSPSSMRFCRRSTLRWTNAAPIIGLLAEIDRRVARLTGP